MHAFPAAPPVQVRPLEFPQNLLAFMKLAGKAIDASLFFAPGITTQS